MSRKFKNYRSNNYSYSSNINVKKIVLIALAVVLVVALAVVALLLLGGNEAPAETTFTIHSLPEKTAYYVGDAPAWSGFKAVLTTPEGNTVTLKADNCKFSGFNSSAPTLNQVITVTYKEYTTTFTISILEKTEQKPDSLFVGMSFKTLPKTQYKVGESLIVDGGVLLKEYEDGSTEEMTLTDYMLDGFVIDGTLVPSITTTAPGKYLVQVSYLEDAKWAIITYEITVTQ